MILKKCCTKCKEYKSIDEFWKEVRRLDGHKGTCISCSKKANKKLYNTNRLERIVAVKKWRAENLVKAKKTSVMRGKKRREQIITAYGSKCSCCGESGIEFLTIEHKNGCGRAHRRDTGGTAGIYRDIIRNNFPDIYTILCMNCNFASRGGRVCPHKKK